MATTKRVTPGREGYKILFNENTVIMNHKFAAAAAKYSKSERSGHQKTKSRRKEQTHLQTQRRGVCVLMATYADNAYEWLKRKGLADKYEHAGIYCIKIDDDIVYIGKSTNMLRRIA